MRWVNHAEVRAILTGVPRRCYTALRGRAGSSMAEGHERGGSLWNGVELWLIRQL